MLAFFCHIFNTKSQVAWRKELEPSVEVFT